MGPRELPWPIFMMAFAIVITLQVNTLTIHFSIKTLQNLTLIDYIDPFRVLVGSSSVGGKELT